MKKEERENHSPNMSPVGFGSIGNSQDISATSGKSNYGIMLPSLTWITVNSHEKRYSSGYKWSLIKLARHNLRGFYILLNLWNVLIKQLLIERSC